jgi:hypothetical protein
MSRGGINYGQPINRAHPLARGLVGFWLPLPWYKSGPRLIDLSSRNHGTLTNGPAWTAGQNGFGAVSFDGSDDWVDCPIINAQTSYTLSAMVNVNAGAGEGQIICNDNGTSSGSRGFQFRVDNSTGVLRLIAFSSGATNGQAAGTTDLRGAGLKHVAATWNGADIFIYVNGVQEGTNAFSGSYANTTTAALTLGGGVGGISNVGTSRLAGRIHYAAIRLGTALPASIIRSEYLEATQGFPTLLNRISSRQMKGTAAAGNRRRRFLCGAA